MKGNSQKLQFMSTIGGGEANNVHPVFSDHSLSHRYSSNENSDHPVSGNGIYFRELHKTYKIF
jgi:hypothetical protein